ncbi:MAG: response regulator [Acidobacteriota bacterium]|nr:response regulator [Acidobacteriota bacterium]
MSTSATAAWLTVLVVDDYEDSRAMFRRLVEARGCAVAEAADGEEAVEAARRVCPGLILLDLNVPRMDGLMAAQRIRELKGVCDGVLILAVTAFDTYGMREAALEAGCDAYITKPLDPRGLDRELRRLIPGWRSLPLRLDPEQVQ